MRKLIMLAAGFIYGYSLQTFAQNTFPENGDVGIGTTTPASRLDVRGGNVNVGVAGDDRYVNVFGTWRTQSTANGLWDQKMVGENLVFHYYTGSSWLINRFLVTADGISSNGALTISGTGNSSIAGNLGIGTASPSTALHLATGTIRVDGTSPTLYLRGGGTGEKGRITLNHYGYLSWDVVAGDASNGTFSISQTGTSDNFVITPSGHIGIGTATPDTKLTVAGNIHSREVKVSVTAGADFVFEEDFKLEKLEKLEKFIKENKHLPEIASAEEMKKNGLDLGEMNIKLLQKIEELTLHLIEMDKKVTTAQQKNMQLQSEVNQLKSKL